MAALADAQDLKVDSAGLPDGALVRGAVLRHVLPRCGPVGDVHVLLLDVHVGEEVLPHVAPVAVRAVRGHRIVLVEVERHDGCEVHLARLMPADQLTIDPEGRAAGGESQDAAALGGYLTADRCDDALRQQRSEVVVVGDDDGADALALARALDRGPWSGLCRGRGGDVALRHGVFLAAGAQGGMPKEYVDCGPAATPTRPSRRAARRVA